MHFQPTFKQLLIALSFLALYNCKGPSARHDISDPVPINKNDVTTRRNIPESHKAFLARFLPEIHTANNAILRERNSILDLRDTLYDKGTLNTNQIQELNRYLRAFRIDPLSGDEIPEEKIMEQIFEKLLRRADMIPVRLVMAQAIIESGWGSSNFAKDGNNYFGVHCYTEGCGVKPAGNDSARFYVKTYPSEMAGIKDYLWILNTGYAYRGLRSTREKLRQDNKPIDPIELAQGLSKYSEKGEEYVKMVSNIIRNYIPENTQELLAGDVRKDE